MASTLSADRRASASKTSSLSMAGPPNERRGTAGCSLSNAVGCDAAARLHAVCYCQPTHAFLVYLSLALIFNRVLLQWKTISPQETRQKRS